MKALLLAGGLGMRLQPITNSVPKCLVPINGKPLLEYWLDSLSAVGISEFLVNTHYLHEQVNKYIEMSIYKDKITITYEKELLNTGGTLLSNKDFFDDEPFLLIHADNLSFCDLKKFIFSHENRDEKCEMTMMLFKTDSPSNCGIVELDNHIVQKFYEKVDNPPSNLANGAVYICEPSILNFLTSLNKKEIDFSNEVIPYFMGKINTFLNDIYHRDIGSLESYALSQIEIRNLSL